MTVVGIIEIASAKNVTLEKQARDRITVRTPCLIVLSSSSSSSYERVEDIGR